MQFFRGHASDPESATADSPRFHLDMRSSPLPSPESSIHFKPKSLFSARPSLVFIPSDFQNQQHGRFCRLKKTIRKWVKGIRKAENDFTMDGSNWNDQPHVICRRPYQDSKTSLQTLESRQVIDYHSMKYSELSTRGTPSPARIISPRTSLPVSPEAPQLQAPDLGEEAIMTPVRLSDALSQRLTSIFDSSSPISPVDSRLYSSDLSIAETDQTSVSNHSEDAHQNNDAGTTIHHTNSSLPFGIGLPRSNGTFDLRGLLRDGCDDEEDIEEGGKFTSAFDTHAKHQSSSSTSLKKGI